MKILQIIDNLNPGGAERVVINLCNWLHNEGIHVELVVIVGRGTGLLEELNSDIEVHFLNRQKKIDFYSAWKLSKILSKFKLAHVHMRHNYRYTSIVSSLFLSKTRLILHDHSSSPKFFIGLNSFFRPRYFIGTSEFSMCYAREVLKMSDGVFKLENVIEKAYRVADTILPNNFILVSNLKPDKNQQFALNLLSYFDQDLYLYGVIQDTIYSEHLIAQVKKNGLSNRVFFVNNCREVQKELGKFKLGLHTSPNETGPLSIIEYLAQGLPFLAYRTGEAAEIISREFPEFFIDNFVVEEWVSRINSLIMLPPDKEKMMNVFETHFSKKVYLQKCLNIYQSVLRF